MKSKQFVLIAIALICGIVSAVGIFQAIASKGPASPKIPMGPVLVAKDHIDLRAQLSEENVSLESWPKHLIPEGSASSMEDVTDKYILTRLRSGQAVILEDVVPASELNIKKIPPGHRVINIKVPSEDLIGGLLEPGDRVDIIGVFSSGTRSKKKSEAKTFLKGIRIFNIGTSTESGDANRAASSSGIVGVLVTERQSEKIVWARKNGEIRLALVGDDIGDEPVEDPDFPMHENIDDEPNAETQLGSGLRPAPAPENKIDRSKLRKVIFYNGSDKKVSYFDEEGNQVSENPEQGSSAFDQLLSPEGSGSSTQQQRRPTPSAGSSTQQQSSGSSARPQVDYEDSTNPVNFPNSTELDQYQGE